MRRRPTASGKSAKPRSPTTKAKRRNKPNASAAREENEVARLTRELDDALERQAATSEVLSMVSSPSGELDLIFRAILEKATRICEANFGLLFRVDNGVVQTVVMLGVPPVLAEFMQPGLKPGPNTATARAIRTRRPIHIADIRQEKGYIEGDPMLVAGADKAGIRTLLAVPMVYKQVSIGSIGIYRTEVHPFTDKQIALVTNFAAQAVIAIENARLLNELHQRTADLTEALEQQTATSEVLQVVSSSPGDLGPVFATMLENATRICEAKFGVMQVVEGDGLRAVSFHDMPPAYAEAMRRNPVFRPVAGHPLERVASTKQLVHVPDVRAEQRLRGWIVELAGARTLLCVPMLKDNTFVGVISIYRQEVRPFTDKQIALVQNFAAQAVIAIENTRLLNELRQSLEQQTATSQVLQVISSSSGDLQPVFGSILGNATRICEADFGVLVLYENAAFQVAATHNAPPAFVELRQRQPTIRASGAIARVVAAKQRLHISDCLEDASYKQGDADFVRFVDLCRVRSLILAPMLKDAELIGVIGIYRTEVRPFADKQIALVQNFANQAVIAIENARLLNELRQRTTDLSEALEQQTATSEVLQVISSSPGDLEPVFTAILNNAVRICAALNATLWSFENDRFHFLARYSEMPGSVSDPSVSDPIQPGPNSGLGRVRATKQIVHITDYAAEAAYLERDPFAVRVVEEFGIRTNLSVPMLQDNELVGAFSIYRRTVKPFSEKQIELIAGFAAQAVIAIENARLLSELRQRTIDLTERTADLTEALERQTATSEVLQAISGSPGDLQPVFATMLENMVRVCHASFGAIHRCHGDFFQFVAEHNSPPAYANLIRYSPFRPGPHHYFGPMIASKSVEQFADLAATQRGCSTSNDNRWSSRPRPRRCCRLSAAQLSTYKPSSIHLSNPPCIYAMPMRPQSGALTAIFSGWFRFTGIFLTNFWSMPDKIHSRLPAPLFRAERS